MRRMFDDHAFRVVPRFDRTTPLAIDLEEIQEGRSAQQTMPPDAFPRILVCHMVKTGEECAELFRGDRHHQLRRSIMLRE